MNIQSFAMPLAAYVNPTAYGDLAGANLWIWIVSHVFFDQKFITIFSMLFGAGIVLMASRAGDDAAQLHRHRMGWLIVFGLAHAYLLWYGDILFAYAVCGLLVFPLRDRGPRFLLVLAAALIVIGSLATVAFGLSMASVPPTEAAFDSWNPSAETLAREIDAYRGGFVEQLRFRVPEALEFQTLYMILFGVWRVCGVMLLGMALFRLDVLTARRAARVFAALAAGGFAIGLPLVIEGVRQNFAHAWSPGYAMFFGTLWNYWGSVAMAIGWTGLLLLLLRLGWLSVAAGALAAVGRMAFTNYILQTIICTTIFYGHGLGWFGSVDRTGQILLVIAICALQLAISPIWLRHFAYGPLEWGWRRLTYGGIRNTAHRMQDSQGR